MAGRSWAPVPTWDGRSQVRTSWYGGAERRVTVVRADAGPSRRRLTTLLRLGAAVAVWAVATYAVALVAGAVLGVESTDPTVREFQIVLALSGVAVWVVAGVPLLLGYLAVRELRERALSHVVVGMLVFRGDIVRGSADDPHDYRLAIDDGTSDVVPARPCRESTAKDAVEGDVVRAVVGRSGRIRSVTPVPQGRATV